METVEKDLAQVFKETKKIELLDKKFFRNSLSSFLKSYEITMDDRDCFFVEKVFSKKWKSEEDEDFLCLKNFFPEDITFKEIYGPQKIEDSLEELKKKNLIILGASVMDKFLINQVLIPEEWGGGPILFPGTILISPQKQKFVFGMFFCENRWQKKLFSIDSNLEEIAYIALIIKKDLF